jgi:hypothetical protein
VLVLLVCWYYHSTVRPTSVHFKHHKCVAVSNSDFPNTGSCNIQMYYGTVFCCRVLRLTVQATTTTGSATCTDPPASTCKIIRLHTPGILVNVRNRCVQMFTQHAHDLYMHMWHYEWQLSRIQSQSSTAMSNISVSLS